MNGLDIVCTIMIFKQDDTLLKISRLIDGFQAYNVDGIITHIIDTLNSINSRLEIKQPNPNPTPNPNPVELVQEPTNENKNNEEKIFL